MESPFDVVFKHMYLTKKALIEDVSTQICVSKEWSDTLNSINATNMEELMKASIEEYLPPPTKAYNPSVACDIDMETILKFYVGLVNNIPKNEERLAHMLQDENINKMFKGFSTDVRVQVNTIKLFIDLNTYMMSHNLKLAPYFIHMLYFYINSIIQHHSLTYVKSVQCVLGFRRFVSTSTLKATELCEKLKKPSCMMPLKAKDIIVGKISSAKEGLEKISRPGQVVV